jgi:anti-sigma factor RsiW
MDCTEFRTLFSDFVDGALSSADTVRCRAHVAACETCRRLAAAYRAGVSTLRSLDPPTPARDLSVRILHRARREPRLAILVGGYGLAGALLVATLAGVVAVDLGDRAETARDKVLVADAAAVPGAEPVRGPDLVTVQVREVPSYGLPSTPYPVAPAAGLVSAYPIQFEVPAVWSGR